MNLVKGGGQDKRQRAERAGRRGEAFAALYLRLKGYKILEQRFKTKLGEIDMIAQRGSVIAFIEVKYRRDFETAIYSVTDEQARRIENASELFMAKQRRLNDCEWRYDIIVTGIGFLPRHIRDAWRP